MLTYRVADERHLVPLLDFITFLCLQGKHRTQRFPRRYNGTSGVLGKPHDRLSDVLLSHEETGDTKNYSNMFANDEGYKRPRVDVECTTAIMDEDPNSQVSGQIHAVEISCQNRSKKGVVTTQYVDIALSQYGLRMLCDDVDLHKTRKAKRELLARQCCYVEMDTCRIITGHVVDVDMRAQLVQVSPDRGCDADVEWVSFASAYCTVPNLEVIQEQIYEDIAMLRAS